MKIEKIKPIPQYILDRIYKWNFCMGEVYRVNHNFFSYLTINDGELVKVTVATRYIQDKWFCKQVAVHGVNSKECFAKDIELYFIGGYVVDWSEEGLPANKGYSNGWFTANDKYFDPIAPVVNPEYVLKLKKYKYSAINKYRGTDIIKFLRLYERFPQVEMFIKLDFHNLALSVQLLRKAQNDKQFRKWLLANKQKLSQRIYSVKVILAAYKNNVDLDEMHCFNTWQRESLSEYGRKTVEKYFNKDELFTLFKYLTGKDIKLFTYLDYLESCDYLHLDIRKKQNRYPANFKKWHDVRIEQKHSEEARKKLAERQEELKNFPNVVAKYLPLQYTKGKNFIAIIATCPEDLINEGEALHHCVGRMNYDIKFAKEQTLIFFIRQVDRPDKPFVTVEYSPTTHKVIQLHGERNSTPDEATTRFIKNTWLPYANKQLRQLQQAA